MGLGMGLVVLDLFKCRFSCLLLICFLILFVLIDVGFGFTIVVVG